MISQEEFVRIINRLKETDDLKNKINSMIRESTDCALTDFTEAGSLLICHEDLVVMLLEKMFNDTDTISWWLYDEDYGRKFKIGHIVHDNGYKPNLSTPEKLYDYLLKEMSNGKKV